MSTSTTLQELGFGEGLARHLVNYDRSSLLGYRCQPPYYWQSSPISKRPITPLWECGMVLSCFHRGEQMFHVCSLEKIDDVFAKYSSAQGLLAALFIDLYEDELSHEEMRSLATLLDFKHIERLLLEAEENNGDSYVSWRKRFPSTCEG